METKPMRTDVTIAVREINEKVNAIDIGGELTSFAEEELSEALTQASAGDIACVILNFRELTYMNSSGIGLLVTSLIRLGRQDKRLVAVELSDHFRQIFELTKLNEAIHLYQTEEEALSDEAMLG
jgi:anti-sigma B factor antagonist